MKKYVNVLFAVCLLFFGQTVVGQEMKQKDADWYNCSFEEDGVYGAAVNKAYRFLKGKELKKTPIIAFIGTGMDVDHEDLSEAIWENPNPERGDVNGWNFIGGRDGEMLVTTPSVADREYARLKDYGDIFFSDGKYWVIKDERPMEYDGELNREEFNYYESLRQTNASQVMSSRYSLNLAYFMRDYVKRADGEMREMFPGKQLMREDYVAWYMKDKQPKSRVDSMCFYFSHLNYSIQENYAKHPILWDTMSTFYIQGKHIEFCRKNYEKALKSVDFDIRKRIVGDDYQDLNDNQYGNDNLFSSACLAEVMRASIAVGKRGNGLGADGIADFAKLMTLCAYPEKGEPYVKDLILSLRYAVDHGADIVVLAYQPRLSTPEDRKWLLEALLYAEDKDVLVVIPVWESADDMDEEQYYPNRFMGKKELNNILVVGPSDRDGKPSVMSNYGRKQVDLFAPAISIYVATTGDTYQIGSGTALGAGTVAGIAALLRGYYPQLSAAQIRDILIKTVTRRDGVEFEKSTHANRHIVQDLFLFDELCVSGGIVNAYQAVIVADQLEK